MVVRTIPRPDRLEVGRRTIRHLAEASKRWDQVGQRHSLRFIDHRHQGIPTPINRGCGGGGWRRLQELAQRVRLKDGALGRT